MTGSHERPFRNLETGAGASSVTVSAALAPPPRRAAAPFAAALPLLALAGVLPAVLTPAAVIDAAPLRPLDVMSAAFDASTADVTRFSAAAPLLLGGVAGPLLLGGVAGGVLVPLDGVGPALAFLALLPAPLPAEAVAFEGLGRRAGA